MPSTEQLQQRLRLILSWRHQIHRIQTQANASAAASHVDAADRDFDLTALETHLIAVETHLADIRREIQAAIQQREAGRQQLLQERQQLAAQVAAGRLTPQEANDRNRAIAAALGGLQIAIDHLTQLAQETNPEAVGGFIDLPLDQYVPEVDAPEALQPENSFWRENRLTLIIAPIVLVLAVLTVLYLRVWSDHVQFQAHLPAEPGQPLLLECTNKTLNPVLWHVPWGSTGDREAGYGIDIFLRESGSEQFRLYTPTQPVFFHDGRQTTAEDPIEVPPGLMMQVSLDTAALKTLAPTAEAAQVACTTHGGQAVYIATLDPL